MKLLDLVRRDHQAAFGRVLGLSALAGLFEGGVLTLVAWGPIAVAGASAAGLLGFGALALVVLGAWALTRRTALRAGEALVGDVMTGLRCRVAEQLAIPPNLVGDAVEEAVNLGREGGVVQEAQARLVLGELGRAPRRDQEPLGHGAAGGELVLGQLIGDERAQAVTEDGIRRLNLVAQPVREQGHELVDPLDRRLSEPGLAAGQHGDAHVHLGPEGVLPAVKDRRAPARVGQTH